MLRPAAMPGLHVQLFRRLQATAREGEKVKTAEFRLRIYRDIMINVPI